MEAQTHDTLAALYGDALDFAQNLDEELSSFHFLLSFFTIPSEVTVLFEDVGLTPQRVTDAFKDICREDTRAGNLNSEPPFTIRDIEQRALGFLHIPGEEPAPIHLLLAILGEKQSIAYRMLQRIGQLSDLRLRAMNILTNPPRRIRTRVLALLDETVVVTPDPSRRTRTRTEESATAPVATDAVVPPAVDTAPDPAPFDAALPDIFRQFGRNLTELAKTGDLEPAYARDAEIQTMLDILGRKKSNNPCLIGPAGSGKTAIVEGLAWLQRDGLLPDRIIWELNLSSLVAGTEFRGVLEKRLSELIAEVDRRKDSLIVFIDEIHLLGSETHEMVATMLKPVLARGNFPLIGATTPDEFKRHIAKDPAMERRFTLLTVEEPKGDALFAIAAAAARSLSFFHHVRLDDPQFVKSAILLSNRYISGRSQPDKVLSLIDTIGSIIQRAGGTEATDVDLLRYISAKSGIPVDNLLLDGARILQTLPQRLDEAIKGQGAAKRRIAQLLARRFARREPHRPIVAFLLAGPTGSGKTETAKCLADYFFGSERKMVVFDMSELQEQHAVSRLIGSPPGYTGYEEGGRLTEAFRREPYQLLLLDEVEKAHPKVLGILLQLLEEGRLTDSRGFTVDLSESIVVMTTNLGAEEFTAPKLGFGGADDPGVDASYESRVRRKIEKFLSPELVNRVDDIVLFTPFSDDDWRVLTDHMLGRLLAALHDNYGIALTIDDRAAFIADIAACMGPAERQYGARAVRRWLESHIEAPVLDLLSRDATMRSAALSCDRDRSSVSVQTLDTAS